MKSYDQENERDSDYKGVRDPEASRIVFELIDAARAATGDRGIGSDIQLWVGEKGKDEIFVHRLNLPLEVWYRIRKRLVD